MTNIIESNNVAIESSHQELLELLKKNGRLHLSFKEAIGCEANLISLLQDALAQAGINGMTQFAPIILRELLQNGIQANLKRVVFKNLKLNPDNNREYLQGMELVKLMVKKGALSGALKRHSSDSKEIKVEDLLENSLDFVLELSSDSLTIEVRNHFTLWPIEEERIRDKFNSIIGEGDLYSYFQSYEDDTEGAGLGIALIRFILKKAGLPKESFEIFSDLANNSTVARVAFFRQDLQDYQD